MSNAHNPVVIASRNGGLLRNTFLVLLFLSGQVCLANTADLKFSVLLDKTEYKEQEAINVTFRLENKGKEPQFVNKRLYLNSEAVVKERRGEVVLKIISPSGKELPCKFSYETGLPKSDYFELLGPSKETTSEYPRNLRGYFSFEEPGVYKVAAVYQNIFGKEIGLNVFKDKLSSEFVFLKIIKE